MNVDERLAAIRIIPVVAIGRSHDVVPLCEALLRAELPCAEITLRTDAAKDALELAASEFPEFLVGAGTVTTPKDVQTAKEAGASFAVAPGLNSVIIERAKEVGLPFLPGVATPSDVEAALQADCTTLKFFPAEPLGGVGMLKAMYAPYRHRGLQFIPTGGITAENLARYLEEPAVTAVGGSWMVAPSLVEAKDWRTIEALAREAVAIVQHTRHQV